MGKARGSVRVEADDLGDFLIVDANGLRLGGGRTVY
jgi:hypothetical protein